MNTRTSRLKYEDIARRAQVSKSTVSRVLNQNPNVSEKTKEKVFSVLRNNDMEPIMGFIGLIVPDVSNPFFAELAFEYERACRQHNRYLLVASSEEDITNELRIIQQLRFLDEKLEGLIYISSSGSNHIAHNIIANDSLPVIVLDRDIGGGNFDFVCTNNDKGTLRAIDYLVASKHTKIGYLKGKIGSKTAEERFESFLSAMKKNKLEIQEGCLFQGDYSFESGLACAENLSVREPNDRPTAILCANDFMAIGLMQRLQQIGWRLPQDLSIIGFDNIAFSEWYYPSLTTIAQPVDRLVSESLRLLLKRIKFMKENPEGGPYEPKRINIEPRLIIRSSVTEPFEPDWTEQQIVEFKKPRK